MSNHASSILEVMGVTADEKTGKSGNKFTIFKLACTINQDDGEIAVGSHDMFVEGHGLAGDVVPRTGFFYPRYEPRARWDSPSFSGVIVELVPVPQPVVGQILAKRYGFSPKTEPAKV